MKQILIDTDVILDLFFDRKPHAENAAWILSRCENRQVIGYITPVICSNLYYLLRQTARHEQVISKLNRLLTIIRVLPMSQEVVQQALSSGFRDFEDALQHFTAKAHGRIDFIITRNVKDYKNSELAVSTPQGFIDLM